MIRLIPDFPLFWKSRRRRALFDASFYLRKYPDVAAAGVHPWLHYLKHGAAERRKPNALFQPDYYLALSPEARSSASDPLTHFADTKSGKWVSPHVLFDCDAYITAHPERALDANPLLHYIRSKPEESSSVEGGYFGAN